MTESSQQFDRSGVRRYEYDDAVVLAADLGPGVDGSVDVVDGTALVVTADEQYEIPVPGTDAAASISNGVLTVVVEE